MTRRAHVFGQRTVAMAATTALVAGMFSFLAVPSRAAAETPQSIDFLNPDDYTGLSMDKAAASCWEIKQLNPASASGSYWLLTPQMARPAQVFCDMDTDGGGWVKVGQGREGWETKYIGKGNTSDLLAAASPASATVQMDSTLVDQILGNRSVSELEDGVRLRRARTADGSAWQETRVKLARPGGWKWTWGSENPVASYSFDGVSGTGGQTGSYGSNQTYSRVNSTLDSNQGWTWGFAYGTGVTGTTGSTTYLWSATNGRGSARPVTEIYVRPKLTNFDAGFKRIADSGTAKYEGRKQPSSFALANPWGVSGLAGSASGFTDVEVQAFTQIGNTMYVGGNFAYVQRDQAGTGRVNQPFLAAFNATTGEFIPSFAPVLNEAVGALAPLANGNLFVGGRFTQANGAATTGAVALNPTTGANVPGWALTLENGVGAGEVRVQGAVTRGSNTYIVGAFTHGTGATGGRQYSRGLMRIASNGTPDRDWLAEVKGTVRSVDVSEDGATAYVAGNFDAYRTTTTSSATAISTAAGANLANPDWLPTWSNGPSYQQAVKQVGDRFWVGGSEHLNFSYDTHTYERLSTNITKSRGGDFQGYGATATELFAGSHANEFNYSGATNWPNVGTGWTAVDSIGWMGAWDAVTGAYINTFNPHMSMRSGSGIWAIAVGKDDETVWAGGDVTGGRISGGSAWFGGFARFPQADISAPGTPSNFRVTSQTATTANLSWTAPAGGLGAGSAGTYQVMVDDRVIAETRSTTITVPLMGERRYFVRAMDSAKNISASSAVLKLPGGITKPTPKFTSAVTGLAVLLDASTSTAGTDIQDYTWDFGDGERVTTTEPTVTHTYLGGGDYDVSLVVRDVDGHFASVAKSVHVEQPVPADAYGAAVFGDQPWAYWRLDESSGDVAADAATGRHRASYQQGVARGVDGIVPQNVASRFDGVDDVVVSTDQVAGPTTYSTEAWFRTTTTRGGKIIGFGGSPSGLSSSYDRHVYMQDDGRLVYGVYVGGEYKITTDKSLNDGLWHHVVATQSTDGMRLYVDGTLAGTNTQNNAEPSTGYWRVGGDRTWGSTSSYFQGDIDEAAVYTTALTPTQVQSHYAKGWHLQAPVVTDPYAQVILSDSPSAYWRLDGSQFGTMPDASPNGFNGVLVDAPVQTSNSGVADGFGSMTFDGSNDGVGAAGAVPGPTSYASEVWFRTTTTRGGKLMGFGNVRSGNSSNYDRHVYMLDDGKIVAGVWTGQATTVTTPNSYNDGRWHHVVAQLGGSTLSLYVDGILIGNTTLPAAIQAYTGYWRLGGDTTWGGSSAYFAGDLDEFAVYSAPLSGARIQAHYAEGTTAPNQLPTASYTSAVDHLKVDVDGSASSDPDGTIASYKWEFGDGSDPMTGTSPTATHTYASAGDFTVKLTVTDNRGGTATKSEQVTTVEPDNQLPTASFTSAVDHLKVDVDGSASSDPDGTIASYKWEFGDGSDPVTGTSPTATHTYASAGDFTVKLTVTDNRGGTATKTNGVTVGVQESGQVIAESAVWRYYYDSSAPENGWKSRTFDDSGWSTGAAPVGYGSTLVTTNLNPTSVTSDRPRAAYFRTDFSVVDPTRVSLLRLTGVADDGVVIYVNGTEVKRQRMESGTISHSSYASSALRTTAANADPVVVEVPTNLLVAGRNVVAAETHVNYRGTPDMSFKLKADITISGTPINQKPVASLSTDVSGLKVDVDGAASSDPDGTIAEFAWDFGDGTTKTGNTATHTYGAQGTYTVRLTVTDNQGATDTATKQVTVAPAPPATQQLVAESASWRYYYDLTAPAASWASSSFNDSSWSTGVGPIGYGSTLVTTTLPVASATNDRPRAVYFRNSFNIADKSQIASLELTGVADDGVVIYVNGVEVGRQNMPSGAVTHATFASTAVRTSAANASPTIVQVPLNLLVNGVNVVSAETHVNYRGTPDMSFKLKAVATLAQGN